MKVEGAAAAAAAGETTDGRENGKGQTVERRLLRRKGETATCSKSNGNNESRERTAPAQTFLE